MPSEKATKLVLNTLRYSGLSSTTKAISKPLGGILMLHRVALEDDNKGKFHPNAHLAISPQFLDRLLGSLQRNRYEFVDLDEAQRRIIAGQSEKPFIAITLDDGYVDNKENAAPIFEKYAAPYTIFIAPGLVDGRATLWWEDLEFIIAQNQSIQFEFENEKVELETQSSLQKHAAFTALLARLTTKVSEKVQREIMTIAAKRHGWDAEAHRKAAIMDWKQLKALNKSDLCNFGAHTIHHYAVARLSEKESFAQLDQSASELKKRFGERPKHFAYPYGYPAAAGGRDFKIAKALGFQTAVTTRHGVCFAEHKSHLTALPRISINGLFQEIGYVETLLSGAPTFMQNKGKRLNVS